MRLHLAVLPMNLSDFQDIVSVNVKRNSNLNGYFFFNKEEREELLHSHSLYKTTKSLGER